jgi:hypothetical protein
MQKLDPFSKQAKVHVQLVFAEPIKITVCLDGAPSFKSVRASGNNTVHVHAVKCDRGTDKTCGAMARAHRQARIPRVGISLPESKASSMSHTGLETSALLTRETLRCACGEADSG